MNKLADNSVIASCRRHLPSAMGEAVSLVSESSGKDDHAYLGPHKINPVQTGCFDDAGDGSVGR